MKKHAARHDRLLQLVRDIAEDEPLTTLRLLQVCGVNSFGHVIAAVPPTIIRQFTETRDMAVVNCLETIQGVDVGRHSTHALPVGAGGRLHPHWACMAGAATSALAYYRIAGPLIARILAMGGCTPRKVADHLLNP